MKPDRNRLALVLGVTVVIFMISTLLFWDFVRDSVVVPLYYLLWIGDLGIKSVPQQAYLAGLVLICVLIGMRTLQGLQLRRVTRAQPRQWASDTTRYAFWRRLHVRLLSSQYSRNHFASEARKLILAILAYQEGIDEDEIEAQIKQGSLPVPPAIQELIANRDLEISHLAPPAVEGILTRLRRLLSPVDSPTDARLNQQVTDIVQFIEYRLEITHVGHPPES